MSSGTPASAQPVGVVGPAVRQVELAVDHRVPARRRRRSGRPRPGRSRSVRRCRCTGAAPRPCGCPSSDRRSRRPPAPRRCRRGADDVVAQVVTDPVGVPAGPGEQVLHAVRIGVPGMLGDRPAVLPRQIGRAARARTRGPAGGSRPAKPGGHPVEQPVGLGVPTARDLRCGPRPPLDHLKSTQRTRITRWPCCVRDRHASKITTYGWRLTAAAFRAVRNSINLSRVERNSVADTGLTRNSSIWLRNALTA